MRPVFALELVAFAERRRLIRRHARGDGWRSATRRTALVVIVIGWAGGAVARAQVEEAAPGRLRIGGVSLTPRFTVTALGIDGNLFREEHDPQRDVTSTFSPQVIGMFKAGPAQVRFSSAFDLFYVKETTSQRSIGSTNALRIDLPLWRLRPHVAATWANVERYPDAEIDQRVRTFDRQLLAGVDVAVSRTMTITADAQRLTTEIADGTVFEGEELAPLLDRTSERLTGTMLYRATPFTTVGVTADVERSRFPQSPVRNSSAVQVMPGFIFSPQALLSGRMFAGVKHFNVDDPVVADFRGLTMLGEVTYVLRGVTRFNVATARDVSYSFSPVEPFYVNTRLGVRITQQVTRNWTLFASHDRERLNHFGAVTAPADASSGVTRLFTTDLGFGRRISEILRVSMTAQYQQRPAGVQHPFTNTRVFADIVYGR